MSYERAQGIVVRASDWSETSRIVTLWTREEGKLRGLAKGGRRLKSAFEGAFDLLNVCDVVYLRKSPGHLDLLTEARVRERFACVRRELSAWYAGQYVAELLGDLTHEHDPHPELYDEATATLRELAEGERASRTARFELVLLRELGYGPALDRCAACGLEPGAGTSVGAGWHFSPAKGGAVCGSCHTLVRDRLPLSVATARRLTSLRDDPDEWRRPAPPEVGVAVRRILGDTVAYLLGRPPRLMPYLGS